MAKPVALLATELGGGRGHVVTLSRVAQALGPDVTLLAGIGAQRHAAELQSKGVDVRFCPRLGYSKAAKADPLLVGDATWACFLAACGFMRPKLLAASLSFWRQLIVQENVSILVADYAPLALRAAHGLRDEGWEIRIITAGTGFGIPPADLPSLPQTTRGYHRVIHPEDQVLASLNGVGESLGLLPLPRLSALYQADLSLIGTFPFLDPYGPWRNPADRVPPLVERSADLARGDEVFVYFSRNEADLPALTEALCRLPLPRRGFLPGASETTKARLAASGMIVEDGPVPIDLIAERSRLIMHPSPHGSLCTAALAGLPQIGLPGHKEQVTHARRAETAGLVRVLSQRRSTTAEIVSAVQSLYHDRAALAHAQDMARSLRADFPADPMQSLAERLAPEVAAARAFATA